MHRTNTCKREGYLEWSDYFMSIAFLSAQRSKDPRTQVRICSNELICWTNELSYSNSTVICAQG